MAWVGDLISFLVTIFVILLLVWFVIYPEPIKYVISALHPNANYEPNKNSTRSNKSTFYTHPNSKHDKLVVLFIGGSGLFSNRSNFYGFTNSLNEKLGDGYDILLFEYPIRFKSTILESMLAINKLLLPYIHYETVHAIGISFGGILAGAFQQKETTKTKSVAMKVPQIGMTFKSLTILSGMFECNFNVDIVTKLFNFYIMRNTPSLINYTCYGIPVPKLVISANTDFLISQSIKFIQIEQCEYKIYNSQTLPHAFCQLLNLDEAKDAIQRVAKFIINVDESQTSI